MRCNVTDGDLTVVPVLETLSTTWASVGGHFLHIKRYDHLQAVYFSSTSTCLNNYQL